MWLIHQFGSLLNLGICKEYSFMARAKAPGNGNTRTKHVATMPAVSPSEHKKAPSTRDLEAEIRRRAYELYEQRGFIEGHEHEDWELAEREVLARFNQRQSA
jgi:hypothetical protein